MPLPASSSDCGIISVACGDEHCLCALSDGSLYAWGKGTQAALGLGGEMRTQRVPKRVSALQGKRVTLVSCGVSSAALCTASHTHVDRPEAEQPQPGCHSLFTFGANRSGELGHGDVSKRTVPRQVKAPGAAGIYAIAMGAEHCVAIWEWTPKMQGRCLSAFFLWWLLCLSVCLCVCLVC
jgi:alpha-tubulin suppressor-like RCC1 family protein